MAGNRAVYIPEYSWINPSGALVFGIGHSLYGLMNSPNGAVYSLTAPPPGGAWTSTTLYTFPGGSGGRFPLGTLAVSRNGTLFGATSMGGRLTPACEDGCGLIFSLTPPAVSGGTWTEKTLYAFRAQNGDGNFPSSGVVLGPDGVLYGATKAGGNRGCSCGTVFSLTPPAVPGEPMTETILHSFYLVNDGFAPAGNLVVGPDGVLYGTTQMGGANGRGIVFELTPPASPGAVGPKRYCTISETGPMASMRSGWLWALTGPYMAQPLMAVPITKGQFSRSRRSRLRVTNSTPLDYRSTQFHIYCVHEEHYSGGG